MGPVEAVYRWKNPQEWLCEKAKEWDATRLYAELGNLARLLDSDQIQDEYQNEMDEDGYFEPVKS